MVHGFGGALLIKPHDGTVDLSHDLLIAYLRLAPDAEMKAAALILHKKQIQPTTITASTSGLLTILEDEEGNDGQQCKMGHIWFGQDGADWSILRGLVISRWANRCVGLIMDEGVHHGSVSEQGFIVEEISRCNWQRRGDHIGCGEVCRVVGIRT
jgi:hypothetical protein